MYTIYLDRLVSKFHLSNFARMRKLKLQELNRISIEEFKTSDKTPIIVILDNIRSMHNVGSFFRTADAFRVEKIYLCGYTPRPPHRDIRKTAIGAENSVEWEYAETIEPLLQTLRAQNVTLIGVEQTDSSILLNALEIDRTKKYAFIFGNEVEGVQSDALQYCETAVEIPQFGTKHSLNVSVAGGVVLYAAALQFGR